MPDDEADHDPAQLREKAERYLRIAKDFSDPDAVVTLRRMAAEYQNLAQRLEEARDAPPYPKLDLPPQT